MGLNWRIPTVFAVVLAALTVSFSLVPAGSNPPPRWVVLGVPLVLAWLAAAGVGLNFTSAGRSFLFAAVCLLVAVPIVALASAHGILPIPNPPPTTTTPTPTTTTTTTAPPPVPRATLTMLEPVGEGTVSPAANQHVCELGENVRLWAAPDEGWCFSEWLVDNAHYSDNAEAWLVMEDNHEIRAVFAERIAPPRPGYVAFRFVTSLTLVDVTTSLTFADPNGPITDLKVDLPWPYLDRRDRLGRPSETPVLLEDWLRRGTGSVYLSRLDAIDNFIARLWKIETENMVPGIYEIKDMEWYIPNTLPFDTVRQHEILFGVGASHAPSLKFSHENGVEWEDGQVVELLGCRTAPPSINAYFDKMSGPSAFYPIMLTVEISEVYRKEAIVVESTFYVPEDDENRVRMDAWIALWGGPWSSSPLVRPHFSGNYSGNFRLVAQLEKDTEKGPVLVRKYDSEPQWLPPPGGILWPIQTVV